jgi:lipopolysaccharide transport system permease protein
MPLIIEANKKQSAFEYLNKVWQFRNLIFSFAKRNVKGKFAQTRLGILILLIQAIILTFVFSFFISRFIHFTLPYPYLLFATTGMMAWYIFSYIANFSGISIIQNQKIVTRVYFPRIILPLSLGFSVFIDIAGWLIVILSLFIYFGIFPGINCWGVLIFLIINIITGLSIGLWIALLSIKNRDITLLAPIIVGVGFFFTPVFYPVRVLPESLSHFLFFNPLAGVVEGLRWSLFNSPFDIRYLLGFCIVAILFMSAIFIFARKDGNIGDNI